MKAISIKAQKALEIGSFLNCADNSGAKILQIIGILGKKGVRRRRLKAGIGDEVTVRAVKGEIELIGQVHRAIIIRQKKYFRRKNGLLVSFEDNAAILVDDKFNPKGTKIKGPVAKEAVERFSAIGKIASIII
jgi:large subunit ribosomal protein L14